MDYHPENFEKAKQYVQSLCASGGTEMYHAVKAAVEQSGNKKIIFLFTDGDVGNEDLITGYVRQHIGKSSLFVFGIDSSVNKKGLQAIAEAGRGKAEFIVRDENIKEIILRQFARVSSTNLFDTKLNPKSNKVTDKIEKQRKLFNHDFYDVLVEVDSIVDDFELQCKTKTQTYSFVLSKDGLARLELPLDKIWAAEQIRRVEKYIEACPRDKNKGYKKQIVELAVEYQINSKYTAFIAVNERDEKLSDIPELQETVLESPAGWDMMKSRSSQVHYCLCDAAPAMSADVEYCPAKPAFKSAPIMFDRFKSSILGYFDAGHDDEKDPFEEIFEKIMDCEKMIIKKENYQALLDEIIEYLKNNHSHSTDYDDLIKKIEKQAPNVYALIVIPCSKIN